MLFRWLENVSNPDWLHWLSRDQCSSDNGIENILFSSECNQYGIHSLVLLQSHGLNSLRFEKWYLPNQDHLAVLPVNKKKNNYDILVIFHLISKNYVLYWDFDFKSWIVDFFTSFTQEKTPQNNFSSQNFSVENNYTPLFLRGVLQTRIVPEFRVNT